MGACATKPKVDGGKAPAPVEDGKEDAIATTTTREIVEVGEDEAAAVARRPSLSNLLNEIVEEKNKAKGDAKEVELTEELKSESIKVEKTVEKQVLTEAVGTSDGCNSELTKVEDTKLPVPQVVTPEVLKITEEVLSSEIPKLSEGTNTKDAAPVEPITETLKPSEVTKTEEVIPVAVPKSEIPKPSEVTKTEAIAAAAPKLETPKPSEVTKVDNVAPEVLKTVTIEKMVAEITTPKPIESSKSNAEAK